MICGLNKNCILLFVQNRSHHTAVAIDCKHICFVGGWDGKKRANDVWIFDTEHLEWYQLNPSPKSDAPVGMHFKLSCLVQIKI